MPQTKKCQPQHYQILIDSIQKNQQASNFQRFMHNFHLADWFLEQIKIEEFDKKTIKMVKKQNCQGYFTIYLQEVSRDYDKKTIINMISHDMVNKEKIIIIFQKEDDFIRILIKDLSNLLKVFLENTIKFQKTQFYQLKTENFTIPKLNFIKKDEEYKKVNHFLAIQGGGAKGSSYVGALQAFYQQTGSENIRSIIGTSVGTQTAISILFKYTIEESYKHLQYTNNVSRYKQIELVSELTIQKLKYYEKKILQIKGFLHDYGILFSEMFDIIRNDILDEELMTALFDQLCGDNQTLRQTFRIKLKPRQYSDKLTNFYGLLDGYLIVGQKLSEVVSFEMELLIIQNFKQDKWKVFKVLNITQIDERVKLENEISYFLKNPVLDLRSSLEQLQKYERQQIKINGFKSKDIRESMIKAFGEENAEKIKNYLVSSLRRYGQRLTMKQYYALTGIELTFTAVDLDDKILRLFNQKTTPQLPISMGSQLSASVPIIFKQLQWKSQWGKYHIHYGQYKKEIDITGHAFSDGGLLANNPMAFLQNQTIRNVYFDHKQDQNSKFIGFGLLPEGKSKIQQKQKIRNTKTQQLRYSSVERISMEDILSTHRSNSIETHTTFASSIQLNKLKKQKKSFSQILAEKIPKLKLLYYQLFHKPQATKIYTSELNKMIKDIPLLDILMKVYEVYKDGNDNFIKECYQDKIYTFKSPQLQHSNTNQSLQTIKSLIHTLKQQIQSDCFTLYSIIETVQLFYQKLNFPNASRQQVKQIVAKVKIYMREILAFIRDNQSQSTRILKFTLMDIIKLADENQTFLFKYQINPVINLQSQIKVLINIMKQSYHNIGDFFKQYLKYKREKDSKLLCRIILMLQKEEVTTELVRLIKKFSQQALMPFDFNVKLLQIRIKQINHKYMNTFNEIVEEQESLNNYIKSTLSQSQSGSKIHLVFEGEGNQSHHYYLEAYKKVEMNVMIKNMKRKQLLLDTISDIVFRQSNLIKYNMKQIIRSYFEHHLFDLKDLKEGQQIAFGSGIRVAMTENLIQKIKNEIDMQESKRQRIVAITCSNYHALIGFYLSTGMSIEHIRVEMNNMLNSIQIHQDIDEIYQEKKWIYTSNTKLNDLFGSIWETRFDLFTELQKEVNHSKHNGTNINLDRIKKEFEAHKHDLIENFDHLMEGLITTGLNKNKKQVQDTHIHYAKKLSLKLGGKDYKKQNKEQAQMLQQLLYKFLSNFEDQFKHIIQYMIQDKLHILKNKDHNSNFWKGVAIDKFLSAEKLKHKIQQRLQQIHLNKNITLEEFNRLSPKQFELTFTGTNLTKCKMEFINHHSYPQMPLYVAIMITLSIPGLFPQVRVKPSWLKQNSNLNHRKIDHFFKGEKSKTSSKFISGNFLMKFPLTHLTNSKIRKLYFNNQEYVFLNFRVKQSTCNKNQHKQIQFTRKFFSLGQLIEFATNIKYFKKMSMENIPLLGKEISYIKTLFSANDHMITDAYDQQLIRLPTIIQSLQFNKSVMATKQISQTTYYCAKQHFLKRNSCFQVGLTFFKAQRFFNNIKINFLTKSFQIKDPRSYYKILYSNKQLNRSQALSKDNYIEIQEEIQLESDILYLLFYYVNPHTLNIEESIFELNFSNISYSDIYELHYNKVAKMEKLKSSIYDEEFIEIKSILNVQKNGLICSECINDLSFQNKSEIQKCKCCSQQGLIKFRCYKCECKYCINCTRNHMVCKDSSDVKCWKGHLFNPIKTINQTIFCGMCENVTAIYYLDSTCQMKFCEICLYDLI